MNLNENIKAFFIDLDGTLLNQKIKGVSGFNGRRISSDNIDAIKKVQKEGKKVIISTGRLGETAEKFFAYTGADYLITGNGALIQDSKLKVIHKKNIDLNVANLVIDFARKHNLIFKFNNDELAYGLPSVVQKIISKKIGFQIVNTYEYEKPKVFVKIVMWGKGRKKIARLIEELKKEIPGVEAVTSGGWTIEVTAKGVTKGKSNAYLASKVLKLDPMKETLHIGDTMNDHSTAKYQRFVVLKNANKLTKSFATHIADKYTDSGVAKVLMGDYKEI